MLVLGFVLVIGVGGRRGERSWGVGVWNAGKLGRT